MKTPTVADAARAYAARGWKPVPVNRKTKKPIGTGWQKRPFDPRQFDRNSQNVAVQLGAESGGLCDVDLDCQEAIGLAPEFLPSTGAIFGRRSKPCSHQFYVSDLCKTETAAAIQYKQFTGGRQGPVIVELRIGGNGRGAATTVPPSMHATGEVVEWVSNADPAHVGGDVLKRAVLKLAVACLLKRHYPGEGSRHEAALVIGGVLARAGWTADDIGQVVEAAARAAGDSEARDRVAAAKSAAEIKANGKQELPGLLRLREVLGKDVADTLARWLALRAQISGKGAGLEDSVALTFAEQHAEGLRYVAKASQWMRWGASRWGPENTLAAFDEARKLCRAAGDAKARTVAGVERLARADRRMAATLDQWDAAPKSFNTPTQEATQ